MQLQASFLSLLMLTFCQELCSGPGRVFKRSLPPICDLPADRGKCRAIYIRWYHNTRTAQCEQFNYGGCEGNENNFLSKKQCQIFCEKPRRNT